MLQDQLWSWRAGAEAAVRLVWTFDSRLHLPKTAVDIIFELFAGREPGRVALDMIEASTSAGKNDMTSVYVCEPP